MRARVGLARSKPLKLDGTRVTFQCSCGRTYVHDYAKGPIPKRMGTQGVAMMFSWWSKQKDGIQGGCPKCS